MDPTQKTPITPAVTNSYFELTKPITKQEYKQALKEMQEGFHLYLSTLYGSNENEWPDVVSTLTPFTFGNLGGYLIDSQSQTRYNMCNSGDWSNFEVVQSVINDSNIALRYNFDAEYAQSSEYDTKFCKCCMDSPTISKVRSGLLSGIFAGWLFEKDIFITLKMYKDCFKDGPWALKLTNSGFWDKDGNKTAEVANKPNYTYVRLPPPTVKSIKSYL